MHGPRRSPSPRTRAAALALAVLVPTAGLLGCTDDQRVTTGTVLQPGRPGEDVATLPPGTTLPPSEDPYTEADVAFLVDMIPHHAQALEMAGLAPDRAADPDVQAIAARIADVQGAEIDVYERWLADHGMAPDGSPTGRRGGGGHGSHAPGDHDHMPGMASPAELDELGSSSGATFDHLWLRLMIAHHEGALEMAGLREPNGTNIRVDELAADVVATQTDEIAMLERLLAGS